MVQDDCRSPSDFVAVENEYLTLQLGGSFWLRPGWSGTASFEPGLKRTLLGPRLTPVFPLTSLCATFPSSSEEREFRDEVACYEDRVPASSQETILLGKEA